MSLISANIRASISLAALLGGLALSVSAFAQQSRLPACPTDLDAEWHNCQGTFAWSDGESYVGEFRNDKRSGQGTFTWSNGETYVGEFRDNKRHGGGVRYSASGLVLERGIWENGVLVSSAEPVPAAPRSAPASSPVAASPPRVVPELPLAAPAASLVMSAPAQAPKVTQLSDPQKRCSEQAEKARNERLGQISAFSSKVLPNYDPKKQSCYALVTIMPMGQTAVMFIELLVDAASNTVLARIEHRRGEVAIGILSDKSYKVSTTPNLSEVQSYVDEKMGGAR